MILPRRIAAFALAAATGTAAASSDPLIGLLITLAIFKITWDSWRLISTTDPGGVVDHRR